MNFSLNTLSAPESTVFPFALHIDAAELLAQAAADLAACRREFLALVELFAARCGARADWAAAEFESVLHLARLSPDCTAVVLSALPAANGLALAYDVE